MQIYIGDDRFTYAILTDFDNAGAKYLPAFASKLREFR